MQLVRPAIDAKLTIKDNAAKSIREKWPEDIAERIIFLMTGALNVLYVAQQSKDYFEVPATEIAVNVWIESFSPKNRGRFGGLATTDKTLFRLLAQHKMLNAGAAGLLFLPVSEILAQGGKQTYISYAASGVMILSPYPLQAGLTRFVYCDKMVAKGQSEANEALARMCLFLFMTVNYHLSMRWPVWVAEHTHPAGLVSRPVFVFGFNPVLDVRCAADALQGARRSH